MSDLYPRQTSESILSDLRASLSSLEAISLPAEAIDHVESAYQSIDRLSSHLSAWEALVEQAQQESIQDRARFISIMTHELRLPMTSIKGYTDLLRQGAAGPVNEQQLSFLTVIRNPPGVEQVILTTLEKDPDRRYPTAEGMLAALTRAAAPALPPIAF